jgi:nicotinate-nucleotide adenylyltransferase
MSNDRLGIFGGSFDPVHYGHLLLAETCREQCGLDRVLLIPAAVSPHKQNEPPTPARDRVEMLRLAIAGHKQFSVSTLEVDRGGVSYTVDTLTALAAEHPQAELFLLMGADSLDDLPRWREPRRICQLAIPVVVRRAGTAEPDFRVLAGIVDHVRLAEIKQQQVEMPIIEFSSTELRQRVADGKSIRYRTPRAVEKYIETHGLYRTDVVNA